MDGRHHEFVKKQRDLKKAQHAQVAWDREVTGHLKTQDLRLMSGSKPENQRQIGQKFAKPTAFSGEPALGNRSRAKTIKASADPPKQKKNEKLGNTFPKTFSSRMEKPPDNLFKTGNVKSIEPWKTPNQAPIMMHTPPLRVRGMPLFPIGKTETVASWKKLMTKGGAQSTTVAAKPDPTGAHHVAPPPPPPPVGAPPPPKAPAPGPKAPAPGPKAHAPGPKAPVPGPAPKTPPPAPKTPLNVVPIPRATEATVRRMMATNSYDVAETKAIESMLQSEGPKWTAGFLNATQPKQMSASGMIERKRLLLEQAKNPSPGKAPAKKKIVAKPKAKKKK